MFSIVLDLARLKELILERQKFAQNWKQTGPRNGSLLLLQLFNLFSRHLSVLGKLFFEQMRIQGLDRPVVVVVIA